jgi:hypothetical protein
MNKIITLVIVGVFLLSCKQKEKSGAEQAKTEIEFQTQDFDWLLGEWKRSNEKKGKETYENWEKLNESEYYGSGFTIQNGDTISQEHMRILEQNGEWRFLVKMPDEQKPTVFQVSEIARDKFVCINDSIEFPNRIEYWKTAGKMNALVSGENLKIPFEFVRIE